MKKKRFWILGGVVLALVAAFFVYRQFAAGQAAQTQYETVAVSRGDLSAVVGQTGTVRANQTAKLTWQTTGRVGTVYAEEGDSVEADQVLAALAPDSLSQSLIMAKTDLVNARKALDELKTSDTASAQAQLNLTLAKEAVEDAADDRTSMSYQRASQSTINGLEADYIMAKQALEDAQNLYEGFGAFPQDDPARAQALSRLSAAEKSSDRALANLNYAMALPDVDEVAQADADVALAEARLADAQREWDRLKDGPDPDDIAAAEARVEAAEAAIAMTVMKAPFAGVITSADLKTGDLVSPSVVSYRIDDLSRLLADISLPEVDINQVKIGQKVTLSFDAIPTKEYHGTVSSVDRVGTAGQGTVNFGVTVEMTDADEDVLPGMTAAVNIITTELNDAVLIPNRAVRTVDGERVVYVLKENGPVMVAVELGASSDNSSQLVSGDVQEGDALILNPPSQMNIGPGGGMGQRQSPF